MNPAESDKVCFGLYTFSLLLSIIFIHKKIIPESDISQFWSFKLNDFSLSEL